MNYKQIAANLIAAKALIDTPSKWTITYFARDAKGHCIPSNDWEQNPPSCFCSIGAIAAATGTKALRAFSLPEATFLAGVMGKSVHHYNDTHTHEEVMAMFDKAIAKAQALAVVQNLEAGKAKIEKPEHWIKNAYAKDADGQSCFGADEDAVCFCSLGALQSVRKTINEAVTARQEVAFLSAACKDQYGDYIDVDDFNDKHTHAEVLKMWDRAVELAKEAVPK